ncbi:MAG TPA: hypothetical protein VGX78_06700 [Pirellulales bacterium]|nr:hypothetical protein [Pirellulales bacterium]
MPQSLDFKLLKVYPLAQRRSLSQVDEILVEPDSPPAEVGDDVRASARECARTVTAARGREAGVLLIYGAHLLRNGAALILERLMAQGWLTHLATNGAGTIHDWEYAWLGRSTESVRDNVAAGTFGAWDETGRNIHLALLAGGLRDEGYGQALGRFIWEDGAEVPAVESLRQQIQRDPSDRLTPARAELLVAIERHGLAAGRHAVEHRWKQASVLAQAFRHEVPLSVHPGIGYDIISNHPMFNGAVIGRAGEVDFRQFGAAVDQLDGGVLLSIGSAIMGPQVFEKSLSCVHNLRLQQGRSVVAGHHLWVVDLQSGGGWDWTQGEPPKSNPAYYLRFCKSFARMGGTLHYVQADNLAFVHHVYHELQK